MDLMDSPPKRFRVSMPHHHHHHHRQQRHVFHMGTETSALLLLLALASISSSKQDPGGNVVGGWDEARRQSEGGSEVSPEELAMLISEQPASKQLWMQAGHNLRSRNQEFALDAFRTVWRLDPSDPAPHEETGLLLEALGSYASALTHLSLALLKNTTHAPVLYSLGNRHERRGDHVTAAALFTRACELSPVYMYAYNNLGGALIAWANQVAGHDLGRATGLYRDALSALWRAVELAPLHPTPLLTCAKLGQKTADFRFWANTSAMLRTAVHNRIAIDVAPWQASVLGLGPVEILQIARAYSYTAKKSMEGMSLHTHEHLRTQLVDAFGYTPGTVGHSLTHKDTRPWEQRVKIGFVSCSGFMGNTTTANFIREVFGLLDATRFETRCYARGSFSFPGGEDGSKAQGMVRRDCGAYLDHTQSSPQDTARAAAAQHTHVLVDLTGYTLFPCIEVFALRPAPVQISWHGYVGSLGGGLVDYVSLDRIASPPEYQMYYDEKLMHTHTTYLLSARPEGLEQGGLQRGSVGDLLRTLESDLAWYESDTGENHTVSGFDDDDVIMCSFNNIYKGDPETLETWVSLLSMHPNVRLWLMKFDPTPPPNIARVFQDGGVNASRVVWSTFFPRSHEFAIKSLCSLFLDWPHFNGHTTAAEALWNGIPILTVCTDEVSGRVGASLALLGACEASSIVARNLHDYSSISQALARRPERMHRMSSRLKESRDKGALLCGLSWTRSWESALLRAVDLALSHGAHGPYHVSPGPVPDLVCGKG